MLAALDAHYVDDHAFVACLTFASWRDASAIEELTTVVADIPEYEPGHFYRRELPCLLAGLGLLPAPPEIVVIDGYVWLDEHGRQGLGAHLHRALGGRAAVVGVAKNPFHGAGGAAEVQRGDSARPLYVSAEGMPLSEAADAVRSMHGPFRVPTLLKRVDQLCREAGNQGSGPT
jgi:deoxyribonuclease V